MFFKFILPANVLLLMVLTYAKADLRSTVYELAEARSGVKSNCTLWTSYFSANGVVRSPVGSTPSVGHDAILQHCEVWNQKLGPQGNGWYPLELWSGNNEVAFQATVRAVGKGGCQINLQGIIVIKFDSMLKINEWNHYFDEDFVYPQLHGKCQNQ